jgi:hypothetical protein
MNGFLYPAGHFPCGAWLGLGPLWARGKTDEHDDAASPSEKMKRQIHAGVDFRNGFSCGFGPSAASLMGPPENRSFSWRHSLKQCASRFMISRPSQ